MVKLSGSLSHFHSFVALVVGDFMLDAYTTGRVRRISPEAPVPVMEVLKQESRPGGAGNVALSLAALGAEVVVAGRIGPDPEGALLKELLQQKGCDAELLLKEEGTRTPVKTRLIAESQQLLRIDLETIVPMSAACEERLLRQLAARFEEVEVVALSDYGKGCLTASFIQGIVDLARKAQVPVIVDPKGMDFAKYRGATIVKPNLSEAYAAAKLPSHESLDAVAGELFRTVECEHLLITRSEAGISLYNRNLQRRDFPVRFREVKDVTGAGDTVLAVISAAVANGLELGFGAQLANIAAGLAIERLGCVQITLSELARRLLNIDTETKVFDDSHTFALKHVLKDRCYTLLVLPRGQAMSNVLFRTLRSLSKQGSELIVYCREASPQDEFIHLLSSLQEVDYIILRNESLKKLCESIHPKEIYFLGKDKPKPCRSASALLKLITPPPKQMSPS